jgi:Trypsin.
MRGLAIFLLAVLSGFRMAGAVIVQGGDGSQNVTADGAGGGWDYVGSVGGASGVYLGETNGAFWVLTAVHVGAGSFTLNGITYGMVAGSAVTLSGNADLVLFRIDANPGLAPLDIASSTPVIGTTLTMIGYGVGREAEPTRWTQDWHETNSVGAYQGYKWSGPSIKRWGTNTVSGFGSGGSVLTTTFYTTFGMGTAQATLGDSGGGVFLADGTLTGLVIAVQGMNGQPSGTSLFGAMSGTANRTQIADLSVYRSEILGIMNSAVIPEPQTEVLVLVSGVLLFVAMRRRG